MKVPEGQPKIAQRFNAGFASQNGVESRRDGRNPVPPRRAFGRPFGACSFMFALPTVETVGYFHSPLTGLADRLLAAKQREAGADAGLRSEATASQVSALGREIDQLVHALYGLTPEGIQIVESASAPASARQGGGAK